MTKKPRKTGPITLLDKQKNDQTSPGTRASVLKSYLKHPGREQQQTTKQAQNTEQKQTTRQQQTTKQARTTKQKQITRQKQTTRQQQTIKQAWMAMELVDLDALVTFIKVWWLESTGGLPRNRL